MHARCNHQIIIECHVIVDVVVSLSRTRNQYTTQTILQPWRTDDNGNFKQEVRWKSMNVLKYTK